MARQRLIVMLMLQVVRGTAAAPLSQLLAVLEPRLRQEAGLGSWQLISPAPAGMVTGRVIVEAALSGVQGVKYSEPTILITDMGGVEDIPDVHSLLDVLQ